MAYLNNPVSRRVRTNNHVERTNRMIRFLEKVRYKWRRRKTLVRFVVLRLDYDLEPLGCGRGQEDEIPPRSSGDQGRKPPTRQQPRRVA